MANTILLLTKSDVISTKLEVYSDISLVSEHANIPYKSLISLDNQNIGCLYREDKTYSETHLSVDNIIDDPEIDDQTKRALFFNCEFTGNAEASDYNARQKQKALFKLVKNINVKAIQLSLHNIFTWLQGERILNPEFGCKLREYLYEGLTDFNRERIVAEIRKCIAQWEPRVVIEKVVDMTSISNIEDNTIIIDIIYSIPTLSEEQYNYTYVYYKTS